MKALKNSIFAFLLLLVSSNVFAYNWMIVDCKQSIEKLAKDGLLLQMMGQNLSKKTKCLTHENIKDFAPLHEPPMDSASMKPIIVSSIENVKITKIVKGDYGVFDVFIKINDQGHEYLDQFSFMLSRDLNVRKNIECAGILSPTEKIYLLKSCQ